jgi:Rps23 Pro-64 3,4-dihydroxylase Tpa1-like proline 4-hydroxylase
MRNTLYFLVLLLSVPGLSFAQDRITISGFVREKGSRELLPGVNIYIENAT